MNHDTIVILLSVGGGILAGMITAVFLYNRWKRNDIHRFMFEKFIHACGHDICVMTSIAINGVVSEVLKSYGININTKEDNKDNGK